MIFQDLFRRYRKIEPKKIWLLRGFTIILLMACLVSYFLILVIEIMAEAPTIIQTFASVDNLPVPVIHILLI
ncbi:hypothetical protein C2G38_1205786 [Gigaspora rosea]|uniref:Uncharacterized protein n=1 Tax=Gigaspora rosea TaxID=44941 RepID=A0A397VET4_9GLOM|nr:hypothetical protein C2G38_1205786 [Gigaspora rosea]